MYLKHQIPRLTIPGKPALKKKKTGIHIYKPGIVKIDETDTWGLPTEVFPSQTDSSTYQPCPTRQEPLTDSKMSSHLTQYMVKSLNSYVSFHSLSLCSSFSMPGT